MDEVGSALISIAPTLCAVFVPLPSRHIRIVFSPVATIAVFDGLCFHLADASPACAVLFKPRDAHLVSRAGFARRLLHKGFDRFNRSFERLSSAYGSLTRRLVRGVAVVLLVYVGSSMVSPAWSSRARQPVSSRTAGLSHNIVSTRRQFVPDAVVKKLIEIILGTR